MDQVTPYKDLVRSPEADFRHHMRRNPVNDLTRRGHGADLDMGLGSYRKSWCYDRSDVPYVIKRLTKEIIAPNSDYPDNVWRRDDDFLYL